MGEANLRFARGDKDMAIRMCMEVIRQDPTAPEPFQTLSTLYEETGEHERSLQFALIGAHLAPQDHEEWARLADMSLELGDVQQAAACYRKGKKIVTVSHLRSEPCLLNKHILRIFFQLLMQILRISGIIWHDVHCLSKWERRNPHSEDTKDCWVVR